MKSDPSVSRTDLREIQKVGIVAGSGVLPRLLLQVLIQEKKPFFLLGLENFVDPETLALAGPSHFITPLGQVEKALALLHEVKVTHVVFAGGVQRPSLKSLQMDAKALQWMAKIGLKSFGDDGLLGGIVTCMEDEGFQVIGVQDIMGDTLMRKGVLTQAHPTREDMDDIKRGMEVAEGLGCLDIGQAIVVEHGVVLGVEAIEGTEMLLKRCRSLRRSTVPAGVLIKALKPSQEQRIDLPSIGVQTVLQVKEAGLSGIALQAGVGLVLDFDEVIKRANQEGLFIVGFEK